MTGWLLHHWLWFFTGFAVLCMANWWYEDYGWYLLPEWRLMLRSTIFAMPEPVVPMTYLEKAKHLYVHGKIGLELFEEMVEHVLAKGIQDIPSRPARYVSQGWPTKPLTTEHYEPLIILDCL